MADGTDISWADATWNPTIGCTKVSPGCDGCYPIPIARIREHNPHPAVADAYAGVVQRTAEGLDWTGRVNLLPERLLQPLRWRKPRRIFVDSMSDLFHDKVSVGYIAEVFAIMAAAHWHTFQVLTKRHARMRSLLRDPQFRELVQAESATLAHEGVNIDVGNPWETWPLRNVWLGVSVEDQKYADIRIPALLDTPAAVRWISAEPLLGPLDLSSWLGLEWMESFDGWGQELGAAVTGRVGAGGGLHWVVTGGESGPGARPMHPDWARTLRDQCQAAALPFHLKQRGSYTWEMTGGGAWPEPDLYVNDVTGQALPEDQVPATGSWKGVWRVGKRAAGRELDGQIWGESPQAVAPDA
jgi:protein gp37